MSENEQLLKIGVVFKSGKEITVNCKRMTWKLDSDNNIKSLEIIEPKSELPCLNYCSMDEIAAIITY